MKLELHREYPELDDSDTLDKLKGLAIAGVHTIEGLKRRSQHAKAIGVAKATFRIADDLPPELRHGVFRDGRREYQAVVRFSNSPGVFEKDRDPGVRGMAIKLLDVEGKRAASDDPDRSQDFIFISHPVFPFPNPKGYYEVLWRLRSFLGFPRALLYMLLRMPQSLKIAIAAGALKLRNPAEIDYWSTAPYWLGSADGVDGKAVKYKALSRQPAPPGTVLPGKHAPYDFLADALQQMLAGGAASFDFQLQVQTDPVAMPVEDFCVEWSEKTSPPITAATVTLHPFESDDARRGFEADVEGMFFTPWHALAEHRPMGGLNRVRKPIYEASFQTRTQGA